MPFTAKSFAWQFKQVIGCLVFVLQFAGDICKQKSRSEAVRQLGLHVDDHYNVSKSCFAKLNS